MILVRAKSSRPERGLSIVPGSRVRLPGREALCTLRRSLHGAVMKKSRIPDFEQSMRELEALVEKLEQGDLPLEEALKQFERGVALTRACQAALKEAEQKVEVLLKRSSGEGTEPLVEDFEPNGD